jgi:hypothetical protein
MRSIDLEISEAGRSMARRLAPADQRRHPRVNPENLRSNLGAIENLSLGGALVVSRRPLRGIVDLVIQREGGPTTLEAEVRWTRRLGFRRFACGLAFTCLTETDRETLRVLGLRS